MMEFFGTVGKFILGSGFEEVVYQAGLCTSGGIKGALTGKRYNKSWMLHKSFAEASQADCFASHTCEMFLKISAPRSNVG